MTAAAQTVEERVVWPRCEWRAGCKGADAAFMRHYSDPPVPDADWQSVRHYSKPTCTSCVITAVINRAHSHARLEPLIRIAPHSADHLALEAAFYALACGGAYTADELRAQQIAAEWRRVERGEKPCGEWRNAK